MNHTKLQAQYDRIYSYFKTTTEPFDFLEWDGAWLQVWYQNKVQEKYSAHDLGDLIESQRQKERRVGFLKKDARGNIEANKRDTT